MEGEAGLVPEAGERLAAGAVNQREARAALGLPAIVLDVRAPRERQRKRVDDVGELGEHEEALAEAEGVHVCRFANGQRCEEPRLALLRGDAEEAVAGARA